MTPAHVERAVRAAVSDGGALGATVVDRATRVVIAAAGRHGPPSAPLLDLLFGTTLPRGALTRACGGPPVSAARELLIQGREHTLFVAVLGTGQAVVLATPAAMSVAVGWTLTRAVIAAIGAA